MDIHLKEYKVGNIRIELTVQGKDGCKMVLTAKDRNNEILWKTYVTDDFGRTKIYPSVEEALEDADARMKSLS